MTKRTLTTNNVSVNIVDYAENCVATIRFQTGEKDTPDIKAARAYLMHLLEDAIYHTRYSQMWESMQADLQPNGDIVLVVVSQIMTFPIAAAEQCVNALATVTAKTIAMVNEHQKRDSALSYLAQKQSSMDCTAIAKQLGVNCNLSVLDDVDSDILHQFVYDVLSDDNYFVTILGGFSVNACRQIVNLAQLKLDGVLIHARGCMGSVKRHSTSEKCIRFYDTNVWVKQWGEAHVNRYPCIAQVVTLPLLSCDLSEAVEVCSLRMMLQELVAELSGASSVDVMVDRSNNQLVIRITTTATDFSEAHFCRLVESAKLSKLGAVAMGLLPYKKQLVFELMQPATAAVRWQQLEEITQETFNLRQIINLVDGSTDARFAVSDKLSQSHICIYSYDGDVRVANQARQYVCEQLGYLKHSEACWPK